MLSIKNRLSPKARAFLAGAALLIALLGVWYVFSGDDGAIETLAVHPVDFVQEVSVSGKVIASKDVDLGFAQSGRVAGVYVSVGQRVGAGTVLAEVENGDFRASLLQREAALENQRAKLEALKAGTRPEEIAVAETTVANAEVALVDALREAYSDADNAVRNTMDQFIENPRSSPHLSFQTSDSTNAATVETQRAAVESALVAWQTRLLRLSVDSDLAASTKEAKDALTQVSTLLVNGNAALNRAITTPTMTQTIIDGYISDVASARASINAATASITTENSALSAAQRNLTLKRAGTTSEDVAAQEAQVKAAEADVRNARAQLGKTLITAPFSGIVTVVDAKIGKIVSSNTPEISMISGGTYQIESFIPEINVALVAAGDQATITLDAYGETVPFQATVVSLDPAETVRDGVSTYRALLQFSTADERIKSGMTANIVIMTEKKEGVIAVPQGIVAERDGKRYVQVQIGDAIEEQEVTLGSVSSLGNVEILSGLSDGDIVILSKAQ